MKKLFLLLSLVGMFFAACESGGGVEEETGGSTPTYKIELSKQTIDVDFEEGTYSVSVTSSCSWKASSDNEWIVVESTTGIAGKEELTFRVLQQTEEKERKGTIVIKNTDFNLIVELYIVQSPFEPKITIDSKSLNFAAKGGEQTVSITANFDYTVSTEASWISYSRVNNGLKIRATANTDTQKRTADIVISKEGSDISEVININQDAEEAKPRISLSKQIIDVDFEEGTYSVSVTSPCSWDAVSKNDWIIVETATGIAGTEELQFRVLGQTEETERKGTIVVKNTDYNLVAELYVVQKAFVPSIIVEPETISFTTEGGEQNIAVTANFEYEVNTSAEWLSCAKNENGIIVTVPNYAEIEERSAEITISSEKYNISKVIKISQGAFEPKLEVAPAEIDFTFDGGSQNIAVTANFEYEVNTSAEWLSCAKNENGITVTVPDYAEVEERTAEITISSKKYNISKTIKVTQTGLSEEEYAKCCIVYTSSDGKVINPYKTDVFGANIVSNTYKDGKGVIRFDAPVTSIGVWAFSYCRSLTSVTIPDSVTSIEFEAFCSCSNLTSVTIPDNVTSIGDYAFQYCSSLTSVTIPNSVTSIGDYAFQYCSSLTAFYGKYASADNRCLVIDGVLNYFAPASLTSYTIPNSVTSIGKNAFYNCSSLTSITIPDSVTSIGKNAFYNCSSLKSVTIPNSVTSIEGYAFEDCSSLTAFYGKYASADNRCLVIDGVLNYFAPAGLTSYTIPNSVTSIGALAFRHCSSLISVTIPDNVTSIGFQAFYGCSSLTSVYCKPTTPPAGGYDMFDDNASGRKIYVPRASVNAYKSASYWSDYSSYIVGYDF